MCGLVLLVVSSLSVYSQWPVEVTPTTEYSQGNYLPFTADLLGEWVMRAPRVLEWELVNGGTSELEIVGSVESVTTEEDDIRDERFAWPTNSAGAKSGVTLDGSEAASVAVG